MAGAGDLLVRLLCIRLEPSISFGAAMAWSHRGDGERGAAKLSFFPRPSVKRNPAWKPHDASAG